jgi:hypothetical protein
VFSSTGTLPDTVSQAFHARHDLAVTEILGSTETGGIASRIHDGGDPGRWHPFAEVKVSQSHEGRLEVDSPFVYARLPRPFETADLVEFHDDGTFTHLGRSDGIVKIGGRRVSIQEVEDCIRSRPDIDEAAVLAVPAEGGRGHQLLAAVVPASHDAAALKTALLKKFEPSCLPRRVLGVDALPREANGKTPRDQLLRLFGLAADGRTPNWTLEWGAPVRGNADGKESLERTVRVPQDYAWFEGHFEQFPVLAGAAQLKDLILPLVAQAFPELGAVTSMSRIKFSGRILPGDEITVRVERGARPGRVEFAIRKTDEVCSRGILSFSQGLER